MAGGQKIEGVCRTLAISLATYHRWQEQHGGADVNAVKELKALTEENAQLKKLVADLSPGYLGPAVSRGTMARSGRVSAPPCARQRRTPETMNQKSHSNLINKWRLAI